MGADRTTFSVFDEHVARDYEAWYEQGFGRFASRQEEALLHQLLQRFPGASSLLEVGCGTGHFTRWFAKQGLQVTGLDASPAMLEQARLHNGTNYLLGDAQALPFEHQRFDLVALITALEFVTDPVQAMREAMRVTRQGLLLGVLNRQSLVEDVRLLRGQHPAGVLAHAHRLSVKELKRCVRQAAGKRSMIITWRTTIFPGRVPPCATWLPWGGRVPGDGCPSGADEKEQGMTIIAQASVSPLGKLALEPPIQQARTCRQATGLRMRSKEQRGNELIAGWPLRPVDRQRQQEARVAHEQAA